jgi:S1-C subfamily serine protease
MFSSAVKAGLLIVAAGSGPQQLDSTEAAAWKRIEPSVLYVMQGGRPHGAAALIDGRGYFIAHKNVVAFPPMFGRMANGEIVQISVAATDEITQLVLLEAQGWTPGAQRRPVTVAPSFRAGKTSRLLAALGGGPIPAVLSESDRVGVLSASRRAMTLSELRFEAPASLVGGAPLFNLDGQLVGILGATLEAAEPDIAATRTLGNATARGMINPGFGPGGLTVAYSVSPDVLERVVQGFLSPARAVAHPALGIFCRDAPGDGAVIEQVQANSPAQQAGLRPGDVILELAGEPIENQIEYAKVLLRQRVGSTVPIKIRRSGETIDLVVRVGQ